MLGVLGPNGAGKTTAVRILATLLRPDAGIARVAGLDVPAPARRVRRHDRPDRPVRLGRRGPHRHAEPAADRPAARPVTGAAAKAGRSELLEWFDLTEAAGRTAKTYCGGMRRRLDLAASLVGRPSVIFLDEPTTGLDPAKREEMWDVVRRLVADGATVLLTTQYLEEADALADEITVIDRGRVIAHDTPDGLKHHVGGQRLRVRPVRPGPRRRRPRLLGELAGRPPGGAGRGSGSPAGSTTTRPARPRSRRLRADGIAVSELSLHLPSLDEVFLTLTGRLPPTRPPRRRHDHHC